MSTLLGKTCLVTGASSGIGEEIARSLVQRGAKSVIVVARRTERLHALAEELGSVVVPHPADLTQPEMIADLVAQHPSVDVLINNAGVGANDPFLDQEALGLQQMIDLNCRAIVGLCGAYLPGMVERGQGWVMNVGSTAGDVPMPNMAVYSGTKAFVKFFTEALRLETRETNVVIHLLAPGPVNTESFNKSRPWKEGEDIPYPSVFLDPQRVAVEALDAMEADRPRCTPSLPVRTAFGIAGVIPLTVIRPLLGTGARQLRRLLSD